MYTDIDPQVLPCNRNTIFNKSQKAGNESKFPAYVKLFVLCKLPYYQCSLIGSVSFWPPGSESVNFFARIRILLLFHQINTAQNYR
jgi:hypothetical protein